MDQKDIDRHWMTEAIALAERGAGRTSPNPMVGAIVVKNGRDIGRGFHEKAGGPHAEVVALSQARGDTEGATMYVTLEPCSHWGKTGPCVEAILEAGVATVVCAMEDPNPQVRGDGIRKLRASGVGVRVGVMRREAMRQNEAHIKFAVTGRPLVTLKVAQTLDGRIATSTGRGEKVSGPKASKFVHALRARYDAVLVGKNTVMLDDPELTVRTVEGRDPLRIVLDSWAKIPPSARIFSQNADRKTIRVSLSIGQRPVTAPRPDCFDWYLDPDDRHQIDLHGLMERAAQNNITSLLVEGGAQVFGSFIREQLADKIHLIVATRLLGEGRGVLERWRAPSMDDAVRLVDSEVGWLGKDLLVTGYPQYDPEEVERDYPETPEENSEPNQTLEVDSQIELDKLS